MSRKKVLVCPQRSHPAWNKGLPALNKGIPISDEQRKKMSIALGGINHPLYGKHHSEETKLKMSLSAKGMLKSKEHRENISKSRMGKFTGLDNPFYGKKHSPETIEHLKLVHSLHVTTEATRIKQSFAHQGPKCHLWKGGISFEPYCVKFNNEFKERVRAFFNYQCVECGTPQNGKKLGVHHVEFNKNTCCDNSKPLFVPLCPSCHTKSGFNRPYWVSHFTEMIDGYYSGKCYLTKEEMLGFKGIENLKGGV
jgi:hypothetical protein